MNDPKYTIVNNRIWHVGPDGPDYPIPDEEPIMVLRGKDPIALFAIREYIRRHPDEAHMRSATERHSTIEQYQAGHPTRVNTDCTKGC